MAIASRDSVTVSIAAESNGILRAIFRVRRVARLTSRGTTAEYAGTRRTSSKVSALQTTRIVKTSHAQKPIIPASTSVRNGEAARMPQEMTDIAHHPLGSLTWTARGA